MPVLTGRLGADGALVEVLEKAQKLQLKVQMLV